MDNEFFHVLREVSGFFPALVLALTSRGFFRALIAWCMGDDTGRQEGFLTFNPVAHVDAIGMAIFLCVIFVFDILLPSESSLPMFVVAKTRLSFVKPTITVTCSPRLCVTAS